MNKDFLPEGYTIPSSSNGYMKLEKGENKFRVLGSAIIGNEWWVENEEGRKPRRVRMDETIPVGEVGLDGIKHFWAFPVWSYREEMIQILQVTQKSIMKKIQHYTKDEDYGHPTGYDLKIIREGEGMETRYEVMASPPKALSPEIAEHFESLSINLEALYDGEDPFAVNISDITNEDIEKALG